MQFGAPVQYDLTKFERKDYRDGYLEAKVRGGIAYQVQGLREKDGLTQKEFGQEVGMKQNAVSRLEDTEYGRVTVQTLLKIAKRRNVALVIQFVSYPEFLTRTSDVSEATLGSVPTIYESIESQKHQLSLLSQASNATLGTITLYNSAEPVQQGAWQGVNSYSGSASGQTLVFQ